VAENERVIRHISDTARWAAVFRARETERPDALFKDPFARKLAGDRGEEIAAALPFHTKNEWSWMSRTYLFDRVINSQIAQGTDMIVNLAAGLDARPYRMSLPPALQWVEVDFPEILDYKEEIIGNAKPVCTFERVRLDLADVNARRNLFDSLGKRAKRILVMTEGLIVYLTADEVGVLGDDLARPQTFHNWVTDLASPGLLKMLQKGTHSQFTRDVPLLKFAPANGPEFFASHGWKLVSADSMIKAAAKLKRLSFGLRLAAMLPENPVKMGSRPWSGVCLFERK
jgi:methyltransferase (TIGR00027 family)